MARKKGPQSDDRPHLAISLHPTPPTSQITPTREVLRGRKSIAAYLGVSPETVTRWIHGLGLPIHHTPHLLAIREEIDAWLSHLR